MSRYYVYIYIYYDSMYDATLHAPFPDGLPKKDPKSAVPAVPTQAKAAWMPRRDEITQWSSHENRGIWPSTRGGFTVKLWKIRISHDFSVCLTSLTIGLGDFPKWSGKSQTDGFNTKTVQLWIIWGYLYVRRKFRSSEVKLPTIWRDEKQSREEAERRERLEERRVEEKESEERRCRCTKR